MLAKDADSFTPKGFRGSPLRSATALLVPSAAARIAARLDGGRLDRALINGADPATSRPLAARAAQLTSACTRARIADGLELLARSADQPRSRVRVMPPRTTMLANRAVLVELAAVLRSDRLLYARGVAMLNVILTDGAGPAYTDRRGSDLARQLQIARAGLTS